MELFAKLSEQGWLVVTGEAHLSEDAAW